MLKRFHIDSPPAALTAEQGGGAARGAGITFSHFLLCSCCSGSWEMRGRILWLYLGFYLGLTRITKNRDAHFHLSVSCKKLQLANIFPLASSDTVMLWDDLLSFYQIPVCLWTGPALVPERLAVGIILEIGEVFISNIFSATETLSKMLCKLQNQILWERTSYWRSPEDEFCLETGKVRFGLSSNSVSTRWISVSLASRLC